MQNRLFLLAIARSAVLLLASPSYMRSYWLNSLYLLTIKQLSKGKWSLIFEWLVLKTRKQLLAFRFLATLRWLIPIAKARGFTALGGKNRIAIFERQTTIFLNNISPKKIHLINENFHPLTRLKNISSIKALSLKLFEKS